MKYIKVGWPEIQDYMEHPDYNKEVSFDPRNNCWFIPEEWQLWDKEEDYYVDGPSIGDLEDALG